MLSGRESPDLLAFRSAVIAYCGRDDTAVDCGDLSDELQAKRALISMLELDFARDAARFAPTYDENVFVNPHPVAWFRETCHMTSHAAATAICVGQQAGRLTRSGDAVAEGRLGFAHLGLMAATARGLDESGSGAKFNESRLIAKAELMSVKRFRTLCAHLHHEADSEAFLAVQLEKREWRTLELTPCGEDGVAIAGFLDPEGGAPPSGCARATRCHGRG